MGDPLLMQIVESLKHLAGNFLRCRARQLSHTAPVDQRRNSRPEDLEDNAVMRPIRSSNIELVEQHRKTAFARVLRFGVRNDLQDLAFVRPDAVVGDGDFDGDISVLSLGMSVEFASSHDPRCTYFSSLAAHTVDQAPHPSL